MRKTKIIITLGPAITDIEIMKSLLRAGANLVRLNFSHGSHEEHLGRINMARQAALELGMRLPIILDNKGPEIRISKFKEGKISLNLGDTFILTTRDVLGDESIVRVEYDAMPYEVGPGSLILLDDGNLSMEVEKVVDGTDIVCRVLNQGELSDRKKVNLPGAKISIPPLNPKDIDDIRFAVEHELDFIAASFIRKAEDVLEIRKIIEEFGGRQKIIAKIESQEGLDNLDEILNVVDGMMVARGDLGVEVPPERVPMAQKEMIRKCNQKAIPIITATQMLDSMIRNPRPTRAEASDIANAILDGTDAIMLSGETASGRYPVQAVETMARIALYTEETWVNNKEHNKRVIPEVTLTDAISQAVCQSAEILQADAIITATSTGTTARMVAKYRPLARIIAVTHDELIANQMCLLWGINPLVNQHNQDTDTMVSESVAAALEAKLISNGDLVLLTSGIRAGVPGSTNMMQIITVGDVLAEGICVAQRSVFGKAVVALSPEEARAQMNEGDILITKTLDSEFAQAVQKASGLITEEEGLTSPAVIYGLSLNIPVMVGVNNITAIVKTGQEITLDRYGRVYRGRVRKNN